MKSMFILQSMKIYNVKNHQLLNHQKIKLYNKKLMTFKQKYIHEKGPFPFNFEEERKANFQKIISLLHQMDRNMWTVSGFNFGSMIEAYKTVYGLTSQQLELLISLLANIFYEEPESSVEPRLIILKLLNRLLDEQIEITENFKVSNEKLMGKILDRIKNGTKDPLKHQDGYMEELSKFISTISKFGQDYTKEATLKAIEQKDTRILVLFIGSLKTQERAQQIVSELLKDSSIWERDISWYFIISQIAKKYPKLDFNSHYVTLFQEVIKIFTNMLDPVSNEELKKLTDSEPCLGIRSILKSIACLLVNLLLPNSYPQSNYVWNAVERIFNIIITTLDHKSEPPFIMEELQFMRAFVKYFLLRYRKQRKIFLEKNEDFVEDFHGEPEKELFVDDWLHKNFNELWPEIIPKILFYEETESMSSKIIVDLAMFDHEFFMPLILDSLKSVLLREDLNIISLYSTKMSLLFLYDFIFKDHKEYISDFLQIFKILLEIIEKLGISENLDILELVLRSFIYMDQEALDNSQTESIIEDVIEIILKNLDTMSISLEENQNEQSELYIDLANIYFPFFVRLEKRVLNKFIDKFSFKLLNELPEHTEAYELLSIICGYIEPKFSQKVMKSMYSKMIGQEDQIQNGKKHKPAKESRLHKDHHGHGKKKNIDKTSYYFFEDIKESLLTKNESNIKWYTEVIQCLYQYHPDVVVRDFSYLQKIIICLLKEWDNPTFTEIALDMIFNIILCLSHVHYDWTEFSKPQNNDYKTMNIKWNTGSKESLDLLLYIYDKYFIKLIDFMKNRYGAKVAQMEDNTVISYVIKGITYSIKSSELKMIDSILLPQPNEESEISQEKKLIYKVFSLQYTVLSAMMTRCDFFPGASQLNDAFLKNETLSNIRKVSNQYCQWISKLMQSYQMFWQPVNLKLYNYFARESLDEVFFTLPLASTVEKLSPYYYSQIYRKKELLRSSFLILNESYVLFKSRLQFLLETNPVGYINNPDFFRRQIILGLHPEFQSSLHSYLPDDANVHQAHRNLMLLCRYLLDPYNKNSYSYKYMNTTEKRQKEKYLMALKMILANIKKAQNPINYECCIKDDFILDSLLNCIQLFKVFENKVDKTLVIDLFYLMMIFGYDCNLVGENKKTDLKKMVEVFKGLETKSFTDLSESTGQPYLCMMTKVVDFEVKELEPIEEKMLEEINLKMKRTSSFRSPGSISVQVTKKIEQFITEILQKIDVDKSQLDKDSILYCLLMIMFSKFLLLSNPIFGRITNVLIKLTKSGITELFDVSKVGLFHIINRFNSLKKITTVVPNDIVKRSFSEFLIYRYLGGQPSCATDIEYYKNVFIDKSSNYFYPVKELEFFEYESLGDDAKSDAKDNQKVMLDFLTSHEQLTTFILSCSHDKDLKEQQNEIDASIFTDQSNLGIASNGHKILNFVLDSNPKKNSIFAPFIENFTIYPISFYPRMLRKVIRMGNQSTIENLIKIAEQLRQSKEIEEKKMSLYISCEIIFVLPIEHDFTHKFIDYLATCSNDIFDFSTQCVFLMFTKNFVTSRKIYEAFIKRFREEKGSSRLRHLTIMNLFIMAQGRFAREVAIEGITHLLKGIEEGSNEVSDVIISMIVSCFVIATNLKEIGPWINESTEQLIQSKKIYKLNDWVGYEIDDSLRNILSEIVAKTKVEKNMEAKNLKIYSKIANKILASISVYRYNDSFYEVLRDLIFYVIEKTPEEGETDEEIILQLRDSEYPENIYYDLINNLKTMSENTPSVIKKKLMLIQSLVINYCYSMNKMQIPDDILKINQKIITIEFIVCVSNMYRLLTREETIKKIEQEMSKGKNKNIYKLMALLLSAGVREYEWKEDVLKEILKSKKLKIVKEFISYWWKGKNPQSESELRLQNLVQSVQNPYSYFA